MNIHALRLTTAALPSLKTFYSKVMGLPVTAESAEHFTVNIGDTALTFVADTAPSNTGVYHFAFNIPENQIAEARAWLAARVPLVLGTAGTDDIFSFESWNAHAVYFYDAAGNIVEFIARHALPTASDAPFGPASLLCVSEIGWVVDEVRAAVRALQNDPGFDVYANSLSDEFAAVGDEHGLFIIVKRGRIWFPDTRHLEAAQFRPIHMTLSRDADSSPTTWEVTHG